MLIREARSFSVGVSSVMAGLRFCQGFKPWFTATGASVLGPGTAHPTASLIDRRASWTSQRMPLSLRFEDLFAAAQLLA
jgi:hypothetical protein